jgi:hypothetical protein
MSWWKFVASATGAAQAIGPRTPLFSVSIRAAANNHLVFWKSLPIRRRRFYLSEGARQIRRGWAAWGCRPIANLMMIVAPYDYRRPILHLRAVHGSEFKEFPR